MPSMVWSWCRVLEYLEKSIGSRAVLAHPSEREWPAEEDAIKDNANNPQAAVGENEIGPASEARDGEDADEEEADAHFAEAGGDAKSELDNGEELDEEGHVAWGY